MQLPLSARVAHGIDIVLPCSTVPGGVNLNLPLYARLADVQKAQSPWDKPLLSASLGVVMSATNWCRTAGGDLSPELLLLLACQRRTLPK